MMRKPVIVAALVVFCCGLKVIAQAPTADQKPVDIKGWHGAEWGMTREQAAAALSTTLDPAPLEPLDTDPAARAYVAALTVGEWPATAKLLFDGAGKLYMIRLTFRTVAWSVLRDELAAKYGAPTSSGVERLSMGELREAKWMLPVTAIRCHESVIGGRSTGVNVWYELRKANPL